MSWTRRLQNMGEWQQLRLALVPANCSANTEPQLKTAASPQELWPGCLQRYLS